MNLDKETLLHIRGLIDELIDDGEAHEPLEQPSFPWGWKTRYIDNATNRAIIHLSGMGEWNDMDKALTMGPNGNTEDFDLYYILPTTSTGMYNEDKLYNIIKVLYNEYNYDKVYLTGISSGCNSIYNYLKKSDYVDGCICVAGKSGLFENNSLPVWHFHNEGDTFVPLQASTINAVNNGDIEKITVYEKSGHDAWTETFKNQDIYNWLKGL